RVTLLGIPKVIEGNSVDIIVVDDGSRDGTFDQAASVKRVKVLKHRVNLGKGAALKTGCDAAYKRGADIMVVMDGDGQHKPEDIKPLVAPVIKDPGVLSIGTRAFSKSMPLAMRI